MLSTDTASAKYHQICQLFQDINYQLPAGGGRVLKAVGQSMQ